MAIEAGVSQNPRQEFFKTDGFILYNSVALELIDQLDNTPLRRVFKPERVRIERYVQGHNLLPSIGNLFLVAQSLRSMIPHRSNSKGSWERQEKLHVTLDEVVLADKYTFDIGIDDLDFPWHFAPVLAATVVNEGIDQGVLSKQDSRNISLDSWADMISSSWFSKLTHTFARTGFNVYKRLGTEIGEYWQTKEFLDHLFVAADLSGIDFPDNQSLIFFPDEEKLEGVLNPVLHGLLRALRDNLPRAETKRLQGKSGGCPVARKTAMLPADYLERMPRARKLIDQGVLSVSGVLNNQGRVLATQELTAIDHTLRFIAKQLIDYRTQYGEPFALTDL